jgi:hypothetical protein
MIRGGFAFEVHRFRDIRALATHSTRSELRPLTVSRWATGVQYVVFRPKPRGVGSVNCRGEVVQPLRC